MQVLLNLAAESVRVVDLTHLCIFGTMIFYIAVLVLNFATVRHARL